MKQDFEKYNIGDKLYCKREYYSVHNNIYYHEGLNYYVVHVDYYTNNFYDVAYYVTIGLRAECNIHFSGSARIHKDEIYKYFCNKQEERKLKLEKIRNA